MNGKNLVMSKDQNANICYCRKDKSLEYFITAPGCSKDVAAVTALPEKWVPRKGGPILANYLKEREQSHRKVYDALLKHTKCLNKEIDEKLRIMSTTLLSDIQQNKRDIDCVVQICTPTENTLMADRQQALSKINDLLSQRIEDLNNFKLESFALERERSLSLKRILQLHFHQLVGVGFKSPKELLHEFDERIYEINQQLMSNSRTYLKLEAKLRAQADENLIHVSSEVNQAFLLMKTQREQSPYVWRDQKCLKESTVAPDNSVASVNPDETNIQSNLSEALQETIIKIFTAISDKLDELHKEISDRNLTLLGCTSSVITGLQNLIPNVLQTMGSVLCNDIFSSDMNHLPLTCFLNIKKNLANFAENLKNAYTILYDASHLSDAHNERLAIVKKIILASLEDLIINNDTVQLANEIDNDIAIEQIRAAPGVEKLQKYYEGLVETLDRVGDSYRFHAYAEIGKLGEIISLCPLLINTLTWEYNCFIANNIATAKSPKSEIKSESIEKSVVLSEWLFSDMVFLTHLQNTTICNWRYEFLETVESSISNISYQVNHDIQLWVDKITDILRTRHASKLLSHRVRNERIDKAQESRLAEIRDRRARLNSHLDAVYELVNSLLNESKECLNMDAPELYPLSKWISGINNDMNELLTKDPLDPGIKKLKMSSYSSRLVNHRQHFLSSLDSTLEQYRSSVKYRLQLARISNIRFLSQLKLFSEGGKYAASEAMEACTALVNAADLIDMCLSQTLDCVNFRRSQLINLADQQIRPIQVIVDEALKNAPKPILNKNKLVGKKK